MDVVERGNYYYFFIPVVKLENAGGGLICIPNATFHIDCNRCKCSPTGMSIDCTDWSCATLTIPHDLLLSKHDNIYSFVLLARRAACLLPSLAEFFNIAQLN